MRGGRRRRDERGKTAWGLFNKLKGMEGLRKGFKGLLKVVEDVCYREETDGRGDVRGIAVGK